MLIYIIIAEIAEFILKVTHLNYELHWFQCYTSGMILQIIAT